MTYTVVIIYIIIIMYMNEVFFECMKYWTTFSDMNLCDIIYYKACSDFTVRNKKYMFKIFEVLTTKTYILNNFVIKEKWQKH